MGEARLIVESDRDSQDIIIAELDLAAMRKERTDWGLFRDRRPDLYGSLTSLDGGLGKA